MNDETKDWRIGELVAETSDGYIHVITDVFYSEEFETKVYKTQDQNLWDSYGYRVNPLPFDPVMTRRIRTATPEEIELYSLREEIRHLRIIVENSIKDLKTATQCKQALKQIIDEQFL